VNDLSESSSTCNVIVGHGQDLLGEIAIVMIFNDPTVTWDIDTIPMKDRDSCILSSIESLIELYVSANDPQMLRDEYSRDTNILDADYEQVTATLGDVIKMHENPSI
jgi:hypothetical protein